MLGIKYGVNPHLHVVSRGLPLQLHALQGEKVSFNAIQDLSIAGGILRAADVPAAVYIKHKLPLCVVTGESTIAVGARLMEAVSKSTNLEFGTLVINRVIDASTFNHFRSHFFHTIVAPDFDGDVLEQIYSPTFQQKNRGVVAISYGELPRVDSITLSMGGSELVSDDAALLAAGDSDIGATAFANTLWREPANLHIALRTLAHARTIGVALLEESAISIVRSGFYDGVSAIIQTLEEAQRSGLDLSRATVLTDGCFGVRQPTRVLTSFGVRSFVFSGGKANDQTFARELEAAGIGALCTHRRYFYY